MAHRGPSFISALQEDLRALSVEAIKRKFPQVKEAAERAILKLRLLNEQSAHEGGSSARDGSGITPNEDILRPFILACESRNSRLSVLGISCLQKVVSVRALPQSSVPLVMATLRLQSEGADEPVQLKVLQVLLTFLAPERCDLHGDILVQALDICFRLHTSKSAVVVNTAAATVRQIATLLFTRAAREDQDDSITPDCASTPTTHHTRENARMRVPTTLKPSVVDAYLFFQDLSLLMNGDDAVWIKVREISRELGMELLEGLLEEHCDLFLQHPEFVALVKERICALMIKTLSLKTSYPVLLRAFRTTSVLVRKFASILTMECEIFLTTVLKMLEINIVPWVRILALDLVKQLCSDPRILRFICASYDMRKDTTNLFELYFAQLSRSIQFVINTTRDQAQTEVTLPYPKWKGLELAAPLEEGNELPPIPPSLPVSMALECLLGGIDAMTSLAVNAERSEEDEKVVRHMVTVSWKNILSALTMLLSTKADVQVVQVILKAYTSFTQTSGILGMQSPRDAFLTSLCKYSLPASYHREFSSQDLGGPPPRGMTVKNVQAFKALFNIAHCLGSMLDSAWHPVLETFEQLYRVIELDTPATTAPTPPVSGAGGAGPGATSSAADGDAGGHSSDKTILAEALKRLFESTTHLDDDSLVHFHSALVVLAQKSLSKLDKNAPSHIVFGALFGSSKFVETALFNIKRIHSLWVPVTTHVIQLGIHSHPLVRSFAVEAVQRLITAALHPTALKVASESGSLPVSALPEDPRHRLKELVTTLTPRKMRESIGAEMDLGRDAVLARQAAQEAGHTGGAGSGSGSGEADGDGTRQTPSAAGGRRPTTPQPSFPSSAETETMLLSPLEELFFRAEHSDTKEKLLGVLFAILQTCGQDIRYAWPVLLKIVRAVAEKADASLVPLGFKSIEIVCSDYLGNVPPDSIHECILTVAAFAEQRSDINISLTAVGLMWTIADFMKGDQQRILQLLASPDAHVHPQFDLFDTLWPIDNDGSDELNFGNTQRDNPICSPGRPKINNDAHNRAEYMMGNLWLDVFRQLRFVSQDVRPDVRNCAVRTFFSALLAHGLSLAPHTWQTILWKILFPLLFYVRNPSTGSENGNVINAELGTEDGKAVMMLVHHSRNTTSKQWDETRVLSLNGLARVFKTFFATLIGLNAFKDAWTILLEIAEDAVVNMSTEVAVAASHVFEAVMQAQGDKEKAFPRSFWHVSWEVYERITFTVVEEKLTPPKVLQALVEAFSELYTKLQECFSVPDTLRLLRMVEALIRMPSPSLDPDYPSHLHAQLLNMLEKVHDPNPEVSQCVLNLLVRLLPHQGEPFPMYQHPTIDLPPPQRSQWERDEPEGTHRGEKVQEPVFSRALREEMEVFADVHMVHSVAFTLRVFAVARTQMARSELPPDVYANILHGLIQSLSISLRTRHNTKTVSMSLWSKTAPLFVDVTRDFLSRPGTNSDLHGRIWNVIINALRDFLLNPHGIYDSVRYPAILKADESLAALIASDIMPAASVSAPEIQSAVLDLLSSGCEFSAGLASKHGRPSAGPGREAFAMACFKSLFYVCEADRDKVHAQAGGSKGGDGAGPTGQAGGAAGVQLDPAAAAALSKFAAPLLLARCAELLDCFVRDEHLAGQMPLERKRLEEALFVLKGLKELTLDPSAITIQGRLREMSTSPHAHLIALFPHLCDLVSSKEIELKTLLTEILLSLSSELGLQRLSIAQA